MFRSQNWCASWIIVMFGISRSTSLKSTPFLGDYGPFAFGALGGPLFLTE